MVTSAGLQRLPFSACNLLSNVQYTKIKKSGFWGPSKGTSATHPVLLAPLTLAKPPLML